MNHRISVALSCLLLILPTAVLAAERAGVKMPDTVTVEGKPLKLQGMGLRSRMMFKVYVAGLYLETPSADSKAILSSSDQLRRMHLFLLRNVEKKQMGEAISIGFKKNTPLTPELTKKLDEFVNALPELKVHDELIFTAPPGKGVTITGKTTATIEGKDFADALFAVWLGGEPVDDGLKKQLLGAK